LALKRRQQLARHVAMIHPTRSDQPRQGDAKLVLLKKLARANSHEQNVRYTSALNLRTRRSQQLETADGIKSETIVDR
jgi:hypothetical protein